MPSVTCAGCGKTFEAKRSSAKFCGDTCRKRGNRRPKSDEPAEKKSSKSSPRDEALSAKAGEQIGLGLVEKTRAELQRGGRLESVTGQHALLLAERMTSPFETGSSIAALSKQFDSVMRAAMDGVSDEVDPLDELEKKRVAKVAKASGA